MRIARALIGERTVEIKVSGIRPGEKIHEILVSEEEAHHCVKRGDYYVILPMLPELREEEPDVQALQREFNSGHSVLDMKQTVELLKRHRLMVEDGDVLHREELLR